MLHPLPDPGLCSYKFYPTGIGQHHLICVFQQAERYVLVEKPLDFDKPIERKNNSPKSKSNKPEGSAGLEESEESKIPQITYFLRLKRLGKIDR